ncbi:hypothetical protein HY212_04270 [Candidatus Pacearchaeota archaeon]|nr:hypothetical protein [Candidatus Pacearchaeota archaeon]
MEKDESYNLYNYAEEFRKRARKEGFEFKEYPINLVNTGNYRIEKSIKPTRLNPIRVAHLGEIVNDQFLLIFTSSYGKKGYRYDRAISRLQRLATNFDFDQF